MMDKNEAVQRLSKIGHIPTEYAEDLYDSFFEKPVVPQYVADWYEENKEELNESIWEYLVNWDETPWDDFKRWMSLNYNTQAITTLVNMHKFGYEVEKEKRYTVKLKNKVGNNDYLVNTETNGFRFYNGIYMNHRFHTRKELEDAGFDWVFSCPGVEVEEAK